MSLTLLRDDLLKLLDVLSLTSEKKGELPEFNGVYLYTTEGEYGEEPGKQTLLAGISSDSIVTGHTYVPIDGGSLNDGIFLSFPDTTSVIKFLKDQITAEEAAVKVNVSLNEVTFTEYNNPDSSKFTVVLNPDIEFPVDAQIRRIEGKTQPLNSEDGTPAKDGKVIPLGKSFTQLLKIGTKLKSTPNVLFEHRGKAYPVSIGEHWVGAISADPDVHKYDADDLEGEAFLP